VTGLRRDASEFPLHLSVGEMEVDGRKLYTGIVRDVTEQRRNEEALRASEARLRESELAARRIAAEQTALRRVASAIAAQASQETVHDRVAQEAARVLGGEMGMVARFEGQNMVVVGSYQQPPEVHVGAVLPLGDGTAVARVARFGRPAHIDDYDRLDASEPIVAAMLGRGVRSAAAAPVLVEGELWGAVAAATTSEAGLPGDAVARLMRFAELVGAAISNAQTRSLLAARATTDQLTNLPNQATFHEKLDGEVERARRYGRPLSLVVFDIDHFKSINDTYGHQAGDRALAAVATRLRELVRSEDTLARVGGEEFAWVMPETASMGAWQAADRARQIVASEPVDGVGTLTISAGVCDVERARSAGELFRLADVALYWAKAQGRNGVVRYSPEVVEVTSASDRDARIARHEKLGSVRMLARAIDARDPSTHAHSERVADLAARLARASGWGSDRVALLREAALVHDVGKIGVPDAILFKADRLTSDEYGQVKAHAPLGAQMLLDALSDEQVGWIRHHHEAWNGCGYPDALREEEIPEGAQLLALADAWDAMTGVRLYRPPRTAEEALSECRAQRGRQFSPGSVDALERAWAAGELRSHRTAVERETGRNGHARRVAAVGERPAPAPRDRL
jgi:diguanylate cyclase (GGDEF)-like protein